MSDKDGTFVTVGVVEELKTSDDKIAHITKSCEDVKRLNGDFAIVNDHAHLRCCVADFNIVVIHLHSPDVTKNGGDTAVGKKKFEEPGTKVADDHIPEAISLKLIVHTNLSPVPLIPPLSNEKPAMEKGEKHV